MNYKNILDLIGNTPMVEIPKKIHGTNNRLLVKLEYFNPTKSLKDRVALAMIEDAEQKKLIDVNTTLIEPTSGNMGISLAFVCGIKGYQLILSMSEAMSIERRKLISHFGAKLILTKKELGFRGAIDKAYELSDQINNSIVLNQYENEANFQVHKNKTGEEIYQQTNREIDIFIAGAGTGACVSGVSSYIKEQKSLYTIAIEPAENNILSGGNMFNIHNLQGIGPNFIPKNFKAEFIDEVFHVTKEQAYNSAKFLAKSAGISCGISSGANAYCAFETAKQHQNKTICFIAADFCERYISSDFF
ncbi:PLP-dependent cysteine synthase family protein [Rickettsiales bacterium LUAb2]